MLAMLAIFGSALAQMQTLPQGANADPTAALQMAGRLMGVLALMIPYYLLVGAIMTAAANRAVLEPDNSAFGYLRLGASELRILVVNLVIGVIIFFAYFAAAIIGGLFMGGFAVAARGNPAMAIPGVLIMVLAILSTVIFLAIKFALAPAQTLDTRSINIFGSWSLTKGRFWKLFCVYLLCTVIVAAVYIVLFVALLAVTGVSAAGIAGLAKLAPQPTSIAGVFAPMVLLYYLVFGLVGAFVLAMMLTPGAFIYQRLTHRAADVF
jgi:hypothetical protein